MSRLRNLAKAPRTPSQWGQLSSAVPRWCPLHGTGCGLANIVAISGGHDRAPVAKATFVCGEVRTYIASAAAELGVGRLS